VLFVTEGMRHTIEYTHQEIICWGLMAGRLIGEGATNAMHLDFDKRMAPGSSTALLSGCHAFAMENMHREIEFLNGLVAQWPSVLMEAKASNILLKLCIPDKVFTCSLATTGAEFPWAFDWWRDNWASI
jgi:hypothetical protein